MALYPHGGVLLSPRSRGLTHRGLQLIFLRSPVTLKMNRGKIKELRVSGSRAMFRCSHFVSCERRFNLEPQMVLRREGRAGAALLLSTTLRTGLYNSRTSCPEGDPYHSCRRRPQWARKFKKWAGRQREIKSERSTFFCFLFGGRGLVDFHLLHASRMRFSVYILLEVVMPVTQVAPNEFIILFHLFNARFY